MTSGVRMGALMAAFALALTGCGGGDDQPSESAATSADGGMLGQELKDGDAVMAALSQDCDRPNETPSPGDSFLPDLAEQGNDLTQVREAACDDSVKLGGKTYAVVASWDEGEPEAEVYVSRLQAFADDDEDPNAPPANGSCYLANEEHNWAVIFHEAHQYAMPESVTGSKGTVQLGGSCEVVE